MPNEDLVTTEGVDDEGGANPSGGAEPSGPAPADPPASPVPPVPGGGDRPGQELEEGEG
ncbi:MAG: hypothetical protein JWO22_309 [Frankiales bacterium]|nr:hypothetical protein [Frankiales bacterium]